MKNYPLSILSSIVFLAIGMSSLLFTFAAHADDAAAKNAADAASEQKLVIKPGDKVYFKLTDVSVKDAEGKKVEKPILTLWQSQGGSNEEVAIPKSQEILLTYDPGVSYQLDVKNAKKEDARCIQSITSANFFNPLNDKIQQNPKDGKKWTIVFAKGKDSVTLAFAGIQRFYRLNSVEVPKASAIHAKDRYQKKGKDPILCVCIDHNGVSMKPKGRYSEGVRSQSTGWTPNFEADEKNVWEIREGGEDEYLIRLRDVNTSWYEIYLLGVPGIRGVDFKKDIIEKVRSDEDKDFGVKFRFSPIK